MPCDGYHLRSIEGRLEDSLIHQRGSIARPMSKPRIYMSPIALVPREIAGKATHRRDQGEFRGKCAVQAKGWNEPVAAQHGSEAFPLSPIIPATRHGHESDGDSHRYRSEQKKKVKDKNRELELSIGRQYHRHMLFTLV